MTIAVGSDTQFVIFSNEFDYGRAMFKDAIDLPNVYYRPFPFIEPGIKRELYKIHGFSRKGIGSRTPFLGKWNPCILGGESLVSEKKTIFIYSFRCVGRMLRSGFVGYARGLFPDSFHIVYWDDIVKPSHQLLLDEMMREFDFIITYDRDDEEKYGFSYFPSFLSRLNEREAAEYQSDVFFIGQAKQRLPEIIKAFEALSGEGLNCRFFVTGVRDSDKRYEGGITYNTPISYQETTRYVLSANCILDIKQGERCGCSLRPNEAFVYRRKLLSNNSRVKELFFYDDSSMKLFSEMGAPEARFVREPLLISNRYDPEAISPLRFLEYLEERTR